MKFKVKARTLAAVAGVLTAFALPVSAAQAATFAPGYEQFGPGCPSQAEKPAVETCMRAEIKSGHFQMGNKDVPISKPMALTAGVTGFNEWVAGHLTPVKQQVPGGVIGLTGLDWLVNFLSLEGLKLYAVTELAGTPNVSNPENVQLPVKVHLINPVLGNNCYVGSNSNPINLNLTIGTTSPPPPNTPISGSPPEFGFEPVREIVEFNNIKYVDNSFAAPGASGCVLTLFGFIPISINGLVNSQSGLPSPAGTNETIQNQDLHLARVQLVHP
ncbi:MAG TPA: hypothetical protein VGV69_04130 [Solirubrobacterales bacterium]|nr:hypothetical protein [Solirubrobacterales bacterium]